MMAHPNLLETGLRLHRLGLELIEESLRRTSQHRRAAKRRSLTSRISSLQQTLAQLQRSHGHSSLQQD